MSTSQLDFYFPFVVFFYGVLVLFLVDFPAFQKVRRNFVLPSVWEGPSGRRLLYGMTFFCGLWSLQNAILGTP